MGECGDSIRPPFFTNLAPPMDDLIHSSLDSCFVTVFNEIMIIL